MYPACFYEEEDGRYSVEIPDLGLATFGDDLPDAIYMASDAAAGRLLLLLKDGEAFPPASDMKDITADDDAGFVSLLYIDLDAMKANHDYAPVKKTLTIPSWLNQAAERKNINFSATLKDALIEKLAR
ncbi:MAG: type II toxin-antitoxin system HicB family antitoxin [Clostridiales Family XIII bacterium]|nr:type II toxin-antitoxin system HicB family antitoxin [Clostridiales Family XIII bacterium]